MPDNPSTYYILVNNNTKDVYSHNFGEINKIFTISETHADFLKMLPVLLEDLEQLETVMKNYYAYALDDSYKIINAIKEAREINTLFKKIHPFFSSNNRRFHYVVNRLLQYCKQMKNNRFIDFLYKNNKDFKHIPNPEYDSEKNGEYQELQKELISYVENKQPTFLNCHEKLLSWKLLAPFFIILYQDENLTTKECNFDQCMILWGKHVGWTLDGNLTKYIYEKSQTGMQKLADSYSVLPQLRKLSEEISEYFSVTSEIIGSFPDINSFQIYALFLTNHYYFKETLDSCMFYPKHNSVYEICRYIAREQHMAQGFSSSYINFEENNFPYYTDDLYQNIKDSFDSDPNAKSALAKKVAAFYPRNMIDTIEIIGVQDFEQIIALEFLDILKECGSIKKCAHPECNIYFMTPSLKIRYCQSHQTHTSYQKKYEESRSPLFNRFYNCFSQRIQRTKNQAKKENYKVKFKQWGVEANKLNQKYYSMDKTDFENKLIELSEKYGFEPPREYKKRSKP